MITACGATASDIRLPDQLHGIDGLIIPGGESTTIVKLLITYDFIGAIESFAQSGKPIWGTCAGAIILAKRIDGHDNLLLGLIDIDISRNAYGRQVDSREAEVEIAFSPPCSFNAVFIRAPVITDTGPDVAVLATYQGNAILARQTNILVSTFHPELTDNRLIHEYFLNMADIA
jgi:5'-phosphate synthase pdxT subunit